MAEENEEVYANVRQFFGWAIGQKVVDITQHDEDEYQETGQGYVMVMFENGGYIKFYIGEGGITYDDTKPNGEDGSNGAED